MSAAPFRPNILFFICHDLGKELPTYGREAIASPNLARLGGQSVVFHSHFCASTPCSPSRGCIQTGRYAHCNGLIGLAGRGWVLAPQTKTIVDYFNEGGYDTWHFGFQHERSSADENRYAHEFANSGRCEEAVPPLLDFLDSPAAQQGPWYANIGTDETHLPFNREKYTFVPPDEVRIPSYLPDNEKVRVELGRFYGAIRFMDDWFGRVMDTLEKSRLLENTVVIFTTDHGAAFPRAKSTLYDPGIETALMIRLPEPCGTPPRAVHHLTSNIDLAPTLLEMAGLEIPRDMQGRSFWPLLHGGDYAPRTEIFSEKNFHDAYDPMRCIRTARYKYIRSFESASVPNILLPLDIDQSIASDHLRVDALNPRSPDELYDLGLDPGEENNLAESPAHKAVRDEMNARLREWMQETGDYQPGPMPEASSLQWKEGPWRNKFS